MKKAFISVMGVACVGISSAVFIFLSMNTRIRTLEFLYEKQTQYTMELRSSIRETSYESAILTKERVNYEDTLLRMTKYLYSTEEQIGGAGLDPVEQSPETLIEAIENASSLNALVLNINNYYDRKEEDDKNLPNILPLLPSPYNRITSAYGMRWNPITGHLENHQGLDLASYYHAEVITTADGVVDKMWTNHPVFGRAIQIRHDSGFYTFYAHLSVCFVNKGQAIKKGSIIGRTGRSGDVTGEHLHYAIWKEGATLNPVLLLNYNKLSTEETFKEKVKESEETY